MPFVRKRRVRSKVDIRRYRWRLKQKAKDLQPMPRRKDLEKWKTQAEKELRENAKRLGVY